MSLPPAGIPSSPVRLQVGEAMPPATVGPLTRTDFVRYAGASGDFHPLHHDEEYAVDAGMESVFGMGMLHAGILGDRLARWVGPENIRSYEVRFTGQVWPGDVLRFEARVEAVTARDGEQTAEIELGVSSEREAVMRGRATARIRP